MKSMFKHTHIRHMKNTGDTDFLCFVERVYVLQRGVEEVVRWVAIDHGQVLPSLQVTAGCLWRLLILLYFLPAVLLLDDPLDLRQRLRSEAAERVDACGREQACHLGIAMRRHLTGYLRTELLREKNAPHCSCKPGLSDIIIRITNRFLCSFFEYISRQNLKVKDTSFILLIYTPEVINVSLDACILPGHITR